MAQLLYAIVVLLVIITQLILFTKATTTEPCEDDDDLSWYHGVSVDKQNTVHPKLPCNRHWGGSCHSDCEGRGFLVHSWTGTAELFCPPRMKCCKLPFTIYPKKTKQGQDNDCEQHGGRCMAHYYEQSQCIANGGVKILPNLQKNRPCNKKWQICCKNSSLATAEEIRIDLPKFYASAANESARDDYSVCGVPSQALRRQKRIVGGRMSNAGMWPWHVGLKTYRRGELACAGILISDQWVLTAAHCFRGRVNLNHRRIIVGDLGVDNTQVHLEIERVFKHHAFNRSCIESPYSDLKVCARKNDIALVKLKNKIKFDKHVQPACLPSQTDNFENQNCWLAGWGGSYDAAGNKTPLRMEHVKGKVLTNAQCKQHWSSLVDEKSMCFGDQAHGGCEGDRGGGLYCEKNGSLVVAGVFSWTSNKCNRKAPVLTDITHYRNWIDRTMNSNSR